MTLEKNSTTAKNRLDPEARPGWGERIGLGLNAFGLNAVFIAATSFLLIYLTNVALLDIAAISLIIGVSKFFDGVSDLIVGNIIDHTESRLGKARIWLLRMCLPFAVSTLLLFYVPTSWPETVKYIYVFIVYNLTITGFYTFLSLSNQSLVNLMTLNRDEQGALGYIRMFFIQLAGIFVTASFVRILTVFSNSTDTPYTQRGFTVTIALLCGVMVATSLIGVFSVRERVTDNLSKGADNSEKIPAGAVLRALFGNKYWVFMFLITVVSNIAVQIVFVSTTYFTTYVLQDPSAMSWMMPFRLFPSLVTTPFAILLLKKVDRKWLFCLGGLMSALCQAGIGLTTPDRVSISVFLLFAGIAAGFYAGAAFGLTADTILYTHYRSGIYTAGMGNAGITAANKIGTGLATALFGFLMSAAGFNAANDLQHIPQPDTAIMAAKWSYTFIPAILYLVVAILVACFYHLDRELKKSSKAEQEAQQ